MQIKEDIKLDFADVLIQPKRSTLTSRSEVSLDRDIGFKHSGQNFIGIPIVAANLDSTGTAQMADAMASQSMFACLSKYEKSKPRTENYAPSYGIVSLESLKETLPPNADYVCLDVANGYTESFVSFVSLVRENFPETTIIAGNVATPEMTEALILAGADVVKVGIGSGGFCLTRRVAGVGYPQLSAVIECADAAHGLGGHIMSDGGCVHIGDVAKAFGAGADFVMLGSMLTGFDECGGQQTFDENDKPVLIAYGMSSNTAMELRGGKADYRASEGRTVAVPRRGPVTPFLKELQGGLRSACSYVGASRLKDLPKRTTFIRVNRQVNDTWRQDK